MTRSGEQHVKKIVFFKHALRDMSKLHRKPVFGANVICNTAAKYLDTLAEHGFVQKHPSGRNNYYINTALLRLFLDVSGGR